MPQFRRSLDVYQGYNFKKDKTTAVGFITSLTIGADTYAVDQAIFPPTTPTTSTKVVAVLSDVLWEMGPTDALYFSGQISITNKQTMLTAIYNALTSVEVDLKFSIYEYDQVAKKYIVAFTSGDTALKGVLEKRGDELNLSVADDMSTQVQSPENYTFNIGVKPQPTAQTLTVTVADTKNITKAWGVAIGA
jgi:hypothetical protein